jgi:hypothetical protein
MVAVTNTSPITLRIDKLRLHGVTHAEAIALVSALRDSLTRHLAADPGALAGGTAEHLRLTLPAARAQGPAALGSAAGLRVAAALSAPRHSPR